MMRSRGLALLLAAALSMPSPALAKLPVPPEQATPTAQLWLARAFVAEAGWYAKRDHVAIGYVLARRWRRLVRRYTTLRFVDVVRLYCTALRPRRRPPSARQRWLQALMGPQMPEGWPRHRVNWDNFVQPWKRAYDRSGNFLAGRLKDPCRGKAEHWGGLMDMDTETAKALVPVDCGETRNTFLGRRPENIVDDLDAGTNKLDGNNVPHNVAPLEERTGE